MVIATIELEKRLAQILRLQARTDVGMGLYEELTEKATKYKRMIEFLKDDNIDEYLKIEENELDEQSLKEHTGSQ